HRLLAVTVAAVAGLAIRQMMVHLGVQRPLGERLLQLVQQAIRVKGPLRISASQKLVKNSVGYLGFLASGHGSAPSFPLCPNHTRNSGQSQLGSYRVALRTIGFSGEHEQGLRANN